MPHVQVSHPLTGRRTKHAFGPIPTHKSQETIKNALNFFNPNSVETDGGKIEIRLNHV